MAEQAKNVDLRIRRPAYTSGVYTLKPAIQWRQDCIKEITRLLTRMAQTGVSEHEIREINDQINKVLKDKRAWEARIKELGGKVINQAGVLSDEGVEIPGVRGYRYFGKARDLPGVKELLAGEGEIKEELKKEKIESRKDVNAEYFGYRDEESPTLLKEEAEIEQILLQTDKANIEFDTEGIQMLERSFPLANSIPSQREVEEYLMNIKRNEMLSMFK